ncbi:tetratricopeptide repeat protein [Pseudothermotoga thermarum]|uniref:tetratricopeptide repeat protein n=1 Tax=Pseudothermotoga thermarum TaxID=119394 RepID=UPI001FE1C663|nr:tetratricopeptide repeat protein [Pseudothermotoga thermarum]
MIIEANQIPLDVIVRGLEAQYELTKDEYYASYLVYFYYEKLKEALNKEDLQKAEEYLEKAGKISKDYRYDFFKALIAAKVKDYESAEIFLRSCLSKHDKFSLAYFELGNILMAKKEYEDAILQYQKAFECDKNFLLPLLKIGDCYVEMGELRQAQDFYQAIVQRDPEFQQAHARLGVVLNLLQKFSHAEKALKKAIQLDPEDLNSTFNLCYTLTKLGKHFEALQLLKKLVEKDPNNVAFLVEYALELRRVGLYEEAVETIEKAYQLSQESYVAYNRAILTLFVDFQRGIKMLKDLSEEYSGKAEELENFLRFWKPKLKPVGIIEQKLELIKKSMHLGKLNLVRLAHLLPVSERIIALRQGIVPGYDTDVDTVKDIELVIATIFASNFDPIEIEKNATKISVGLYGSGIMLAVAIALARLYIFIESNEVFNLQEFLRECIPDIQEYHWNLALRMSRLEEEESFSFEEIDFDKIETGSDFLITLIKTLATEPSLQEVETISNEVFKDTIKSFLKKE